jgi:hypothetical protein
VNWKNSQGYDVGILDESKFANVDFLSRGMCFYTITFNLSSGIVNFNAPETTTAILPFSSMDNDCIRTYSAFSILLLKNS